MILITHAVVGAALSRITGNPMSSFMLAVVSHYILDAVPHYDYVDQDFVANPRSRRSRMIFKFIMLDGVLGVFLPLWFFGWSDIFGFLNIFLAIVGAMLPDAFSGVHLYLPNRITPLLNRFHVGVHYLFINKLYLQSFPILGLFMQGLIIFIFLYN